MAKLYLRRDLHGIRAFLFIAILVIIATTGMAAGSDDGIRTETPAEDFVILNYSGINGTGIEKFQKSPETITIIRAEVSDTSLPGPRYMAFGPSTIEISISPVVLSSFVVLLFLGIGIWGIRSGMSEEEEPGRKE